MNWKIIGTLSLLVFCCGIAFSQIADIDSKEPVEVNAGRAVYKFELKRLLLEHTNQLRPVIQQGPNTLKADTIIYDDATDTGYAFGNVYFENRKERLVLTAGEATYFTEKQEIILKNNPVIRLQKDGTLAKGDVIKIYPKKDYLFLIGNVWITNGKMVLQGDQATLFQKKGIFRLTGHASARQETTLLTAERIDVDSRNGKMDSYSATGNVSIFDEKEGTEIQAGRLDYYKASGYTRMTENPVIIFTNKNIRAYALAMEQFDSEKKANLLGNVVIVQGTKKAYARWGEYRMDEKVVILSGSPVMVDGNSRLEANKIRVDVDAGTMSMIGRGSGTYDLKVQ